MLYNIVLIHLFASFTTDVEQICLSSEAMLSDSGLTANDELLLFIGRVVFVMMMIIHLDIVTHVRINCKMLVFFCLVIEALKDGQTKQVNFVAQACASSYRWYTLRRLCTFRNWQIVTSPIKR